MSTPILGLLIAFFSSLSLPNEAPTDPRSPHPHYPKALIAGCAAGQAKLLYFTVPYNKKYLTDVKDGFEWHLGFATFETEVPLRSADGSVDVPVGRYKFNARFDAKKGHWNMVLANLDWIRAENGLRRAKRMAQRGRATDDDVTKAQQAFDTLKKKVEAGDMVKDHLVPLTPREHAFDEHMAMAIVHRGYATVRRGSEVAAAGAEFSLLVDFGDLHYEASFQEVWQAKPEGEDKEKKD